MAINPGISYFVEKHVGYVYSEDGVYEPDMIAFTVLPSERIEIGDIVCIEHPSKPGIPVFYQVEQVPLRRRAKDYEEDLARMDRPLIDDTRNYPRALAKQIGYYENLYELVEKDSVGDEEPLMLIEHVKPLDKVYRPRDRVIRVLLEPGKPSISIGRIYPSWKHELKLDLQKLTRQGLLVVGGVGTGKTTTMLSVIRKTVEKIHELGGIPHILIIDKDGEYNARELIEAVGQENYLYIPGGNLAVTRTSDKESYARRILATLGYTDKRTKEAKILYNAITSHEGSLEYTPEFLRKEILPKIKQQNPTEYSMLHNIRQKIDTWEREWKLKQEQGERQVDVNTIVGLLAEKQVVHIDLSKTRDMNKTFNALAELLRQVYDRALVDETYGAIIVVDEAHLYAPEKGGVHLADEEQTKKLKTIIELIATTGPRNGVTLFMATQRPSLISKTITTQMGQNIIAHRVEDIDLARITEIMGEVARRIRVLPRGWALVKALAAKLRQPLIVKIEKTATPTSTGKTAYDRFLANKY